MMPAWPGFSLIIVGLLLAGMSPNVFAHHDVNSELTSTASNGQWVNDSIDISGSTTIPANSSSWVLYDITEPYVEWPVLRNGDFFSTVTPVDESLWIWTLSIDVQGLNCICWLEISLPDGLQHKKIFRVFFIGEGPHNPIVSPEHEMVVVIDEPVVISSHAFLADGDLNETMLEVNWCSAPQGACYGELFSDSVNLSWTDEVMTFTIDADSFNLSDGNWEFNYSLIDATLRTSPKIYLRVYVDQTDPIAVINGLSESNESQMISFDGSSSSDGVWSNLQYTWYLTDPNGDFRAAGVQQAQGAHLTLNESITTSGQWQIRLDVTDMVGRRDTTYANLTIHNKAPVAHMSINHLDGGGVGKYQINQGDELILDASNSLDSDIDMANLEYSWLIDGEEISQNKSIDLSEYEPGTYQIDLIVSDDENMKSELQLMVIINKVVEQKQGGFNLIGTVSAIAIIILIIYFIQFRKTPETVSTLPKWQKKSTEPTVENDEVEASDSGMWQDPSNKNQGKD
jgi:hypothetical protein